MYVPLNKKERIEFVAADAEYYPRMLIHLFENTELLVYMVDLMDCFKKTSENKYVIQEHLLLYKELFNWKGLRNTSKVVILNNYDLFVERIKDLPLCFPQFENSMKSLTQW